MLAETRDLLIDLARSVRTTATDIGRVPGVVVVEEYALVMAVTPRAANLPSPLPYPLSDPAVVVITDIPVCSGYVTAELSGVEHVDFGYEVRRSPEAWIVESSAERRVWEAEFQSFGRRDQLMERYQSVTTLGGLTRLVRETMEDLSQRARANIETGSTSGFESIATMPPVEPWVDPSTDAATAVDEPATVAAAVIEVLRALGDTRRQLHEQTRHVAGQLGTNNWRTRSGIDMDALVHGQKFVYVSNGLTEEGRAWTWWWEIEWATLPWHARGRFAEGTHTAPIRVIGRSDELLIDDVASLKHGVTAVIEQIAAIPAPRDDRASPSSSER